MMELTFLTCMHIINSSKYDSVSHVSSLANKTFCATPLFSTLAVLTGHTLPFRHVNPRQQHTASKEKADHRQNGTAA